MSSLVPLSLPPVTTSSVPATTTTTASSVSAAPTTSLASAFKFFPAPPVIPTYYKYQDVNNDIYLQEKETFFFLDKTIDWIKHDKSFQKLKRFERYLKGPDGYTIMHKLLKLFVRRGDTNWYDLKVQQNLVKDYIKHKLSKIK